MSFTSIDRVQLVPDLSNINVGYLSSLINASESIIETYTNKIFNNQILTEIYNGNSSTTLKLDKFPVTSVTSVTVVDQSDDSSTVYNGSVFYVDLVTGVIRFNQNNVDPANANVFLSGFQNITVVYVAGYTTVPEDIIQAVIQLILFFNNNAGGIKSEKIGDYAVSYSGSSGNNLPQYIKNMLDPYRHIVFG